MSIQRVMQDPIPFLILLGLILLTVWLWRWFKDRWFESLRGSQRRLRAKVAISSHSVASAQYDKHGTGTVRLYRGKISRPPGQSRNCKREKSLSRLRERTCPA